jgi:hypothetical protein
MIKNGGLPAMPQTNSDNLCMQTGTPKPMHSELTKREMFAMAAMQGLLAYDSDRLHQDVAPDAIAYADALLAELERTNGL